MVRAGEFWVRVFLTKDDTGVVGWSHTLGHCLNDHIVSCTICKHQNY